MENQQRLYQTYSIIEYKHLRCTIFPMFDYWHPFSMNPTNKPFKRFLSESCLRIQWLLKSFFLNCMWPWLLIVVSSKNIYYGNISIQIAFTVLTDIKTICPLSSLSFLFILHFGLHLHSNWLLCTDKISSDILFVVSDKGFAVIGQVILA